MYDKVDFKQVIYHGGDVFDRYPYDKPGKDRVYERTLSGEIVPWEQSNWVLPTDYEQYETIKNE